MWHLYLDESGDLGFDFVNKKPSRYFTVCILATSDGESFRRIRKAVVKTIRRKARHHNRGSVQELKGSHTEESVKRYFWEQICDCRFGIYAVTLNKLRLFDNLRRDKSQVYNFVARLVVDEIPFEKAKAGVRLVVDKSKGKTGIDEFNEYIMNQLKGRIDPATVPINIDHRESQTEPLLQAADLFAWGIFRRHEHGDRAWYKLFKEKIVIDRIYLQV